MSEQNKAAILGEGLKAFADSPLAFLLGFGLMVGVPILAVKWDGSIYNRHGCVQLQEIHGKVFKVDSCTGKIEEINGGESSGKDVKK